MYVGRKFNMYTLCTNIDLLCGPGLVFIQERQVDINSHQIKINNCIKFDFLYLQAFFCKKDIICSGMKSLASL